MFFLSVTRFESTHVSAYKYDIRFDFEEGLTYLNTVFVHFDFAYTGLLTVRFV